MCGARIALLQNSKAQNEGSKTLRGADRGVQNSAGHRSRTPKLCGAKIEGRCAPQSYGSFVLCHAEFGTSHSVPRWVMEQCNPCPANLWRQIFSGQNNHNFFLSRNSYFLDASVISSNNKFPRRQHTFFQKPWYAVDNWPPTNDHRPPTTDYRPLTTTDHHWPLTLKNGKQHWIMKKKPLDDENRQWSMWKPALDNGKLKLVNANRHTHRYWHWY